jgi:hypothetical protein
MPKRRPGPYKKTSVQRGGWSAFAAAGGRSVTGFAKAKKVKGLPTDTEEERQIAVSAYYKALYRHNTGLQALNARRKAEKAERDRLAAIALLGIDPLE